MKSEIVNETVCYNPATGEEIGKSEIHSANDLKNIIEQARLIQISWQDYPVKKRIAIIKKIRDYIVRNGDEIADLISRDNGKTRLEALATEVLPAAMAISYYCSNAKSFLSEKSLRGGNIFLLNKRSKIVRIPYGVIGIISPWNYPFVIPFSEVIMGLLAGNAVVLKTATENQLVGLKLKEAVDSAGLPEGLFSFVNLPGKVAGDEMLKSGVNKLFFTGSVTVGKYLMGKASDTLTPVCLELGGNDAMIVCEDADPYRAAMGALWAGFQNAGQSCGGVERIYLHEKIYDQFLQILKKKIDEMIIKDGSDYNSQMGCMTTIKQVHIVNEHIKDAVEKGAIIYAQSKLPESSGDHFVSATVLTNVDHNMLVMKDETFGPVVGVMKFKNIEDAINLANDSHLGLTGSVWSKNQKYAVDMAKRIKAGVVTINDHLMSHGLAETPWGGFKESGLGRTHGKLGFYEMTQPMVIIKDILSFTKRQLWWHPYSKKVYDGLRGLLDLLYSKSLIIRIRSISKLVKILPRLFKKE